MTKRLSINKLLETPALLNHDGNWSFYDWFCDDAALPRKAKSMLTKIKFLVKQGLIDGDKIYVEFKNNCPMEGALIDNMRFYKLDDNTLLGGITPDKGKDHYVDRAELWLVNDHRELIHQYSNYNWMCLKEDLKTDEKLIQTVKNHFNNF